MSESATVHVPLRTEHVKRTGTVTTSINTILCNIIGGAILALPASLHHASLVYGCLLILYVGILSGAALVVLTRLTHHTQEWSYIRLFRHAFEKHAPPGEDENDNNSKTSNNTQTRKSLRSRSLQWLIQAIVFWYTFGVSVSFVVIIADSMQPLASSWMRLSGFYASAPFWILLSAPLLFAISCTEHISELHRFSFLSVATMIYVAIGVAIRYIGAAVGIQQIVPSVAPLRVANPSTDFFQAFPVLTVAYAMHYNLPQLYAELEDRRPATMYKAILPAMVIIMALYLQVGIMGYLQFGPQTHTHGGDILFLYAENDILMNIGRFLMLFHFVLGYPMVSIACRRTVNLLFFHCETQSNLWIRTAQTFLIVATSCALAAVASGITEVFVFNGVLFGIPLVMIIPAWMYWRVFRESMRLWEKAGILLLGISGCFFAICGFVVQLRQTILKE